MTDDVRLSVSLRRHRKTKRLKRLLGADGCWALVCLFLWVGEERWTGDLAGLTDADIEEEADWDGEPGALIDALIDTGFMEGDEGQRKIHDWAEHNPYASGKGQRIEKAREAANKRWKGNAPSMPQACDEHAPEQCPPAPTPTLHTPKQKQERSPNGSRLPADWVLPADWRAWAVREREWVDVDLEGAKFSDYWRSQPGAKGRKTDWQATWRNWIRNAGGQRRGAAPSQPSRTLQAVMALGGRNAVDQRGSRTGVPAAALPWPGATAGLGHDGGNGAGVGVGTYAEPGMGPDAGRATVPRGVPYDDVIEG